MKRVLFVLIGTIFLVRLLYFPNPTYSACQGAPLIPLSVSPSSGGQTDKFTVTLGWGQMSDKDFEKYKNLDVYIVAIDEKGKPVSAGPDHIDQSYTRSVKTNRTHTLTDFFIEAGNHQLIIHLTNQFGDVKNCTFEQAPSTVTLTSTTQQKPQPGTTSPKKLGDVCDPNLQTNPQFQCPTAFPCQQVTGGNLYTCGGTAPATNQPVSNVPEGSGIEALIKPLRYNPNDKSQQPYDPVNPYNPEKINEGDTRVVEVRFIGLDKPPKSYHFCLQSDILECRNEKAIKSVEERHVEGENILIKVCGRGEKALKEDKDCDDPEKVWFHAGNIYRISLYAEDKVTKLAEATFYVKHFYPSVYIKTPAIYLPIAAGIGDSDAQSAINLYLGGKEREDKGRIFEIPLGKNPPFSLEVLLTGRKFNGDKENNYQIVVEGLNVNYKEKRCTAVLGNELTFEKGVPRNQPPAGWPIPGAGDYTIKISEHVGENRFFGRGVGGCQGGFTYWHIPGTIDIDNKGDTDSQNDEFIIFIDSDGIEMDPNESDIKKDRLRKIAPIPCATGALNPVTKRCTEVVTALGNFPTEPHKFLGKIFGLILSLAGVIAFILLITAGYRLMTSGGDKEKLAGAREQITSAIVGLLFIIFSLVVLQIIGVDILRIPGLE